MTILHDKPIEARYDDGRIYVSLESGLEFSFSVAGNPRLEGRFAHKLGNIELSAFGLHWPDLDEGLSLRGVLSGDYGQRLSRS